MATKLSAHTGTAGDMKISSDTQMAKWYIPRKIHIPKLELCIGKKWGRDRGNLVRQHVLTLWPMELG